MLVQNILATKGEEVVTVAPDARVSEVARVLSEKRIGTVVVSSDGKTPEGILSERDIVRELACRAGACLDDKVSACMTTKISVASRNDNVDHVLARMTEGRFRHMPVVEDGALVGIVTLGDVVKAKLSEMSMEKDALEGMIMGF